MVTDLYDNKTFEKAVYANKTVKATEFYSCTFKKCDFSDSIFANNKFIDCVFEDCNLSMMQLNGSTLNNAVFRSCKLLGVVFSHCQDFLFSVLFDTCILDYASFMGKKMLKAHFTKSSLREVNFTRANLSGSVFTQTDLSGAVFNGTNLALVNFTQAFNYTIDPELNNVKKAIFTTEGLPGLLTKYDITIV